jgi:hypothetical protein
MKSGDLRKNTDKLSKEKKGVFWERERESYGTIDNLSFEKRQREEERLGLESE